METYAVLSPRGEPRPLCPLEGGDHRHVGHVGVRAGASRPHPSLGLQNLACNREGTIPSLQKLTSDREDVPFSCLHPRLPLAYSARHLLSAPSTNSANGSADPEDTPSREGDAG